MSPIFIAIVIAQITCVIDMLMRGRTLRLPVAGGAATQTRKSENPVIFYIGVTVWIALFVFIDVLIWG